MNLAMVVGMGSQMATAMECALIAALISVAITGAVSMLGPSVSTVFWTVGITI